MLLANTRTGNIFGYMERMTNKLIAFIKTLVILNQRESVQKGTFVWETGMFHNIFNNHFKGTIQVPAKPLPDTNDWSKV